LFKRSADLGYAPAQSALAHLYETGRGVTQDTQTAVDWYLRAAAQGDPDAREAIKRLVATQPK
jgi:uncharacterized protein